MRGVCSSRFTHSAAVSPAEGPSVGGQCWGVRGTSPGGVGVRYGTGRSLCRSPPVILRTPC